MWGRASFLIACGLFAAADVAAGQQGRASAGLTINLAQVERDATAGVLSPAPGGWAEITIAPRARLVVQGAVWPQDAAVRFQTQGGKSLQLFGGIRGDVIKWRRAVLYAAVLPGVVRVTSAVVRVAAAGPERGQATHFVLSRLVGLEFRTTTRWLTKVEYASHLFSVDGTEIGRSGASGDGSVLVVTIPPETLSRSQLTIGAGFRFGRTAPEAPESATTERWQIIAQVGHAAGAARTAPRATLKVSRTETVGIVTAYRLAPHAFLEALVSTSTASAGDRTPFYGGRELQGLGGLKVGASTRRIGVFAKARAGVHRYASVVTGLSSGGVPDSHGARNTIAGEFGAVAEIYPRPGQILRVDLGDALILGRESILNVPGNSIRIPSQGMTHRLQVSIGFGWIR
jgi:hypothetical protein